MTQVGLGSRYHATVSGLRADVWATVGAHYADAAAWGSGWTNGQGNITIGPFTATTCGQIYHEAKQLNLYKGGSR